MPEEYTRSIAPARALAAETSQLERALTGLVNHHYVMDREDRLRASERPVHAAALDATH